MLIKKIIVENIRSYQYAEVVFPDGIVLLSGDIGSGKSTILQSIEFALFGIIKGELNPESLLRNGCQKASVELFFELNNKEIRIKRSLKKTKIGINQEPGYIIIDGIKTELAPVELKSRILEILGYPIDLINKKNLLFRYTVYTPQEEMKKIIFENKEDRLDIIRKVFGLEKYKIIKENTVIIEKKLKEESKIIEGFISDIDEKKTKFENITKKIEEYNKQIEDFNKKINSLKEEISSRAKDYYSYKEQYEKYLSILNQIALLETEFKEINIQIETNNSEINSLNNEMLFLKDQLEEKKSAIVGLNFFLNGKEHIIEEISEPFLNKLEEEIQNEEQEFNNQNMNLKLILNEEKRINESIVLLERKIAEAKNKIKEQETIQKTISFLEQEILKKEEIYNQYQECIKKEALFEAELETLLRKNSESKEIINNIISVKSSRCPLCQQNVDSEHRETIIKNENEKIAINQEKISKIEKEKERISNEKNILLTKLKKVQDYETEKNNLILKYKINKSIIDEIEKNNIELNNQKVKLNELSEKKKSIHSLISDEKRELIFKSKQMLKDIQQILNTDKAILEKNKEIRKLVDKNELLKKRINEINKKKLSLLEEEKSYKGIEDKLKSIDVLINEKKEILKNFEIQYAEINAKITSHKDELNELNAELNEKINKKKDLARKKQYLNWLQESFLNIISAIEKNILSSVYSEFNTLFKEWFDLLLEDELIEGYLDEEFTPKVIQNGYEVEIENLSGGEKTALALAYRLSLNKAINDITISLNTKDIILLDEPTDGFSEQQLDKIRDVLNLLNMKQIIIVSHENKIESFVDHIIRISKEEHNSIVL